MIFTKSGRRGSECGASGFKSFEPATADVICEKAHMGDEAGSEAEFAFESGDGIHPCIRVGADPLEDGSEVGIDEAGFIGPNHASGAVDQIKIFNFGHGEDTAWLGIRRDGA